MKDKDFSLKHLDLSTIKSACIFLVLILLSLFAYADATIDINFNPGVYGILAYDCLNDNCSQVREPFSGRLPFGVFISRTRPLSPNTLRAVFLTNIPQNATKYYFIFTSPDFLPKEQSDLPLL